MTIKLMIADMDSTIIENECIDELAAAVGVEAEVSAITEQAMLGKLDFESALRDRVGMLAGMPEATLQSVYDNQIRLTPGARTFVQTLRKLGATCVLVSGGFTFFTSRVAAAVGFDAHVANVLDIQDGVLTGAVNEPILGANAKLETLKSYATELGITNDEVLAIGDGANDVPMIKAAGTGVGFCPKPVVAEASDLVVTERDLTRVLVRLGIAESEFVN